MAIEKIKILGTVLELPAKQHCQSSPFTKKLGQMGLILVLLSCKLLNGPQDFDLFNCHVCQTFNWAEIHCYLSALKSWNNNSFLSGVECGCWPSAKASIAPVLNIPLWCSKKSYFKYIHTYAVSFPTRTKILWLWDGSLNKYALCRFIHNWTYLFLTL